MKYLVSKAKNQLKFISCGNDLTSNKFNNIISNAKFFIFIYIKEGMVFVNKSGKEYFVDQNDFIIIFKNQKNIKIEKSHEKLSCYWVEFTIDDFNNLNNTELYNFLNCKLNNCDMNDTEDYDVFILPEYDNISNASRVSILISQLYDIAQRNNSYSKLHADYGLSLLMMEITQEYISKYQTPEGSSNPTVQLLIDWLKLNYNKNFSINSIANNFGYSNRYLTAVFKENTGYTLIEYIHKLRLDQSKVFLSSKNLSVKDVSHFVGFNNEKYFSKIFKKYEEMTPSEYRKSLINRL